MKKSLLILTLLNIGLGQPSDSLINVYTYPAFSNISNPKILSYGDDKVIVAGTNSNDEASNILFLVIDHDGNMINSTEYPDQNYLIDFVTVPDGSYIIATDYGLWRLMIVDNNFNFSFLTNEFNGNEIISISANDDNTFNVTTTQSSPSEILQFDLDGELVSSFNVYDAEQDTYVNESFVDHIKTSDGGFLFLSSNRQRIYKANYEGLLEWNKIYNIDYISDITETNGEFILVGSYVDWYGDYDGCDYNGCAISILIDELGNEILNSVFSSATYFNSCIVIDDGYIFAGNYIYGGFEPEVPFIARVNENLDIVWSNIADQNEYSISDVLRIDENRFFSVGIDNSPPNYSSTLSIWHYYFEPLPELSNCIAEDGTDGVDLWGICYSIENTDSISLTGAEIQDTIPPIIGNLVNLTSLEINWTEIHGNIPSEIGYLTNLETLHLHNNQLSGEIPPEIGNLLDLYNLNLSYNQLSGEIPSEIGNLSLYLTSLYLNDNQFSGQIPESICNLNWINVPFFEYSFDNNQLCPPNPTCIYNIGNQDISNCDGVVEIFGEWYSTEYSTRLYLPNSGISGPIPPEIWELSGLTELWLNGNQLTGSIPPEIGNLTNLGYLNLSNNQITGSIPPEIGNCPLSILRLQNNQLTGSIPPEIFNYPFLSIINLSNNQLTGSIPPEIGDLSLFNLYLNDNQLSGLIPDEICNNDDYFWPSNINFNNNQLCTPYPSCIEDYVGEQDTSNCENVSVSDDLIPYTYKLYSAYPNPFNPFTTLRYDLSEGGLVNITIYDMLGNAINQLVNEVQSSGYKSIQWDATNNQGQPVSAGVYLYSIQAGEFRQTKKMILLK